MVADWEYRYNSFTFGGSQPVGVLSVQGFDPPDIREDVVMRSGRHGAYTYASLYDPRRVLMQLDLTAIDASAQEALIQEVAAAFAPQASDQGLEIKRPGMTQKRLWCRPSRIAYPHSVDTQLGYMRDVQLELLAGDPFFYEDTLSQVLNTAPGATFVANNPGTHPTVPELVRFTGPGTTFTFKNNAVAADKLQINTTLTGGQEINIDYRLRTIFKSTGENLYGSLSADSRWWEMAPGNTTVAFTVGSGSSGATEMDLTWRGAWIAL